MRPGDAARLAPISAALAALPEVRLSYLFGSRASGRARAASDWDVAVLVEEEAVATAERWWTTFRRLANAITLDPADIVLLNRAGAVLRHRVARDGALLFARSEAERVRFLREAIRDVQDGAVRRAWVRSQRLRAARAFLEREGAGRG